MTEFVEVVKRLLPDDTNPDTGVWRSDIEPEYEEKLKRDGKVIQSLTAAALRNGGTTVTAAG